MSENKIAIDELLTTIDIIVKERLNQANFDRTKRGIVKKVLGNNKYKIEMDGAVYTVPSLISETLNEQDAAYILFPQGNCKDKIIIGKAV